MKKVIMSQVQVSYGKEHEERAHVVYQCRGVRLRLDFALELMIFSKVRHV
jgi:hypothetical protein